MERWVVDTSVLVQGFVQDADSARVFAMLGMMAPPVKAEIHVPEFCMIECTNVLWKRARFAGTNALTITQTLNNLLHLPLSYYKAHPLMLRALDIGLAHGLAIYDSVYIALAEVLACPLITVDQRQSNAAIAAGVALKPITDFPASMP